jgi:hypothetical protein
MPRNRVRRVIDIVIQQTLKKYVKEKSCQAANDDSQKSSFKLAPYTPGLLFYPIPEAGYCLRYIDVGFWATALVILIHALHVIMPNINNLLKSMLSAAFFMLHHPFIPGVL